MPRCRARGQRAPSPGRSGPPTRQALGAGRVEVAVGDGGTDDRQGQLATVRVAGDDQARAVGNHGVEDALVGRVEDTDGEGCVAGSRAGDRGIVVELDVRVIDADEVERIPSAPTAIVVRALSRSTQPEAVNAERSSSVGSIGRTAGALA